MIIEFLEMLIAENNLYKFRLEENSFFIYTLFPKDSKFVHHSLITYVKQDNVIRLCEQTGNCKYTDVQINDPELKIKCIQHIKKYKKLCK